MKYISNDNVSFASTSASFTYNSARPVTLVDVTVLSLPFKGRKLTKNPQSSRNSVPLDISKLGANLD